MANQLSFDNMLTQAVQNILAFNTNTAVNNPETLTRVYRRYLSQLSRDNILNGAVQNILAFSRNNAVDNPETLTWIYRRYLAQLPNPDQSVIARRRTCHGPRENYRPGRPGRPGLPDGLTG